MDLRGGEGSPNREQAKLEAVAENVRLAYVALTRAKERCYMLWGAINKAGTSAPAYLLHGGSVKDGKVDIPLDLSVLIQDLEELAGDSENAISVLPPPEDIIPVAQTHIIPNLPLAPSSFSCNPDLSWSVTSFSALAMDKPGKAEPGNDEARVPGFGSESTADPQEEAEASIFTFPRGIGPGIMLHDIFENLDFIKNTPDLVFNLVWEKIKIYGFEEQWVEPVLRMVHKCPVVPFAERQAGIHPGPHFPAGPGQ